MSTVNQFIKIKNKNHFYKLKTSSRFQAIRIRIPPGEGQWAGQVGNRAGEDETGGGAQRRATGDVQVPGVEDQRQIGGKSLMSEEGEKQIIK